MQLRRFCWTWYAAVLIYVSVIGRCCTGAASSFLPPSGERGAPRRCGLFVCQLRTSSRVLLYERHSLGKDSSPFSSIPQAKDRRDGIIRPRPTSNKQSPPIKKKSTESLNRGRRPRSMNGDKELKAKEEEEKMEEVDVHHVSDATALLACRAYLVRRQRLGPWKKRQERRDRLTRSSLYRRDVEVSSSTTEGDGSTGPAIGNGDPPRHIGYFWEDTAELKYYVSPRRRRSVSNRLSSQSRLQLDDEPVDEAEKEGAASGGIQMSVGVAHDEAFDVGREDDRNVDIDDDGNSPAWEFASRPVTYEEEAAVDDLCDELDDGDEFQADDGATEDAGLVGVVGPSMASFAYDDVPPVSYVRRSQAAKKCWSQPEFREKWYAARWGDERKKALRLKQGDADKEKLRRVSSSSPLPMEAVADMTEEEIAHAIRTYLSSKQKRRESRSRSKSTHVPSVSSDSSGRGTDAGGISTAAAATPAATLESLYPSEQELLQRRVERSERAAKAYQTRLANQNEGKQATTASSRKLNQGRRRNKGSAASRVLSVAPDMDTVVATPHAALVRIETRLDAGVVPLPSDVELALKPVKLSRRKQAFRRILLECFGLRGKCVPSMGEAPLDKPPSTLVFVTQASVDELGAFCLSLIREAEATSA